MANAGPPALEPRPASASRRFSGRYGQTQLLEPLSDDRGAVHLTVEPGLLGGLALLPDDMAQLADGLAFELHELGRLSEHLAEGGDGCLDLLGGSVLLSTARPCLADGPRGAPGGDGSEEQAKLLCIAAGLAGHVSDAVVESEIDLSGHDAYVAGPRHTVVDVVAALQRRGVALERIFVDSYGT